MSSALCIASNYVFTSQLDRCRLEMLLEVLRYVINHPPLRPEAKSAPPPPSHDTKPMTTNKYDTSHCINDS